MPTSWEQKRAAIAAALAGGNPPSVGASPMVNPMIAAMSPQAPGIAGGSPGLMGAAPTQGQMMAQANASLAGAPGFDYVPPPVGPPPVPVAAGPVSVPMTDAERRRLAREARLLGGGGGDRGSDAGRSGNTSGGISGFGGWGGREGYGQSSSGRSGII